MTSRYAGAPVAQLRPAPPGAWARGRPVVGALARPDLLSHAGAFELLGGLVVDEHGLEVTDGPDASSLLVTLAPAWADHVVGGDPIAVAAYGVIARLVASGALRPPAEAAS